MMGVGGCNVRKQKKMESLEGWKKDICNMSHIANVVSNASKGTTFVYTHDILILTEENRRLKINYTSKSNLIYMFW